MKPNTEYWNKKAESVLLNQKIVTVRYLTKEESEGQGFQHRPVGMQLENGTWIFPSMDDEGNDAGALFTTNDKISTLPVLSMDFK